MDWWEAILLSAVEGFTEFLPVSSTGHLTILESVLGYSTDDPDVTAIFASNDQMALGVLRALHESGRRVPDDVSVVGYDDIPEAAFFPPPLTTLRQDFAALGTGLMARVEDLLADRAPSDAAPQLPELVVRASTSQPR